MFRNFARLILVAGLCLAMGPTVAQAAILMRFEPDVTTVGLNQTFDVSIVADITEPVIGWGLDFTIDDSAIVSIASGPTIGPGWFGAPTNDGDGLAGVAFPDSIMGTDILLATVTLSADALGETDLLLSVTAGDLSEGFALDPDGFGDVFFENGHVTVIPEPTSLLLVALLGCSLVRRTRTFAHPAQ